MMMLQNKESFSSSFRTIFTASDEEIFERCGDDSLQYLRFQRYIICYLVILMLLSVCLILPLNIQGMLKDKKTLVYLILKFQSCLLTFKAQCTCYFIGTIQGSDNDFERTTLANLTSDNPVLWVHICVSFFSFPLSIFMMRRFSSSLNFVKTSIEISKTLMVENIDRNVLESQDAIRDYFKVIYILLLTTDS